jgi:hypothetical protein
MTRDSIADEHDGSRRQYAGDEHPPEEHHGVDSTRDQAIQTTASNSCSHPYWSSGNRGGVCPPPPVLESPYGSAGRTLELKRPARGGKHPASPTP